MGLRSKDVLSVLEDKTRDYYDKIALGTKDTYGWKEFTDAVISALSEKKSGIVFMLWGAFARKKSALIDRKKHFILPRIPATSIQYHIILIFQEQKTQYIVFFGKIILDFYSFCP